MSYLTETLKKTNNKDFVSPYRVPVTAGPSLAPKNTGVKPYLPRQDADVYGGPLHTIDPNIERYKQLMKKEQNLYCDIAKITQEMSGLLDDILKKNKSEDEIMKTIYQVAHEKRDPNMVSYRSLMAAADAPVGSPIELAHIELTSGYRNPEGFRFRRVKTPVIQPAKPVDFTRVPEMYSAWATPFIGRSEYMDTIGKPGLGNLKHLEPHPSSRRQWDDLCP